MTPRKVVKTVEDPIVEQGLSFAIDELRAVVSDGMFAIGDIGIPMPSFCLQYLLQTNLFKLGRFTLITGEKANFKSLLALEIARWHHAQGGPIVFIDTEGDAAPLARDLFESNIIVHTYKRLEDWTAAMFSWFAKVVELVEDGAVFPYCFVVDSIVGANTEKTGKTVENKGVCALMYSEEARGIKRFFGHSWGTLHRSPASLIMTNRIREVVDPITGVVRDDLPGGVEQGYRAQLILKLKRLSRMEFTGDVYQSAVRISVMKNRYGADSKYIDVPLAIYAVDDQRYTVEFKWAEATIALLTQPKFFSTSRREKVMRRIQEIVDINSRSGGNKGVLYYSNTLGISKSDALPADAFARVLETNKEVINELSSLFMIRQLALFRKGVAYDVQLKEAAQAAAESSALPDKGRGSDVSAAVSEEEAAGTAEEPSGPMGDS